MEGHIIELTLTQVCIHIDIFCFCVLTTQSKDRTYLTCYISIPYWNEKQNQCLRHMGQIVVLNFAVSRVPFCFHRHIRAQKIMQNMCGTTL